ncbi:MAG: hypothetical protein QOG20_2029, partial [Pseudonocardiales bacterium]|nr:hypothetical protein [Pseudonocardiales bacterium]
LGGEWTSATPDRVSGDSSRLDIPSNLWIIEDITPRTTMDGRRNMAQVTEVRLVDDLDGGAAAESIAFGLDGKTYEIDLSETHAAELRDALAPFVSAARRGGAANAPATRQKTVSRSSRSREETAAIREWANANGHEVSSRGRIPSSVLEAYENRGSVPAPAPVEESEPEVVAEAPKRRSRKKAAAA